MSPAPVYIPCNPTVPSAGVLREVPWGVIYERLGSVLREVVSLKLLVGCYSRPRVFCWGSWEGERGEPVVLTGCGVKNHGSPRPAAPCQLPRVAKAAPQPRWRSQPLPSSGRLGESSRLTQQPEDQVQLFLHRGAGEHRPAGDHLVVDAANTPKKRSRSGGVREREAPRMPHNEGWGCWGGKSALTGTARSPRGCRTLKESPPPFGTPNAVGTCGAAPPVGWEHPAGGSEPLGTLGWQPWLTTCRWAWSTPWSPAGRRGAGTTA